MTRRRRKGAVTRLRGQINRLISEEDPEGVDSKLAQIKQTFTEFEGAHVAYHDLLQDEEEIEASEEWFAAVEHDYIVCVKSAKLWLKSLSGIEVKDDSSIAREELMSLLSIPKVEIEVFSGNPVQYLSFMAIFDELIGRKAVEDQVKLTRLLQYTTGPAKAAIRNCALVGGHEGYQHARDILSNRFGNPHLISLGIMSDLKNGKAVRTSAELQQLADELTMAVTALKSLEMFGEIDNQCGILEVLSRCPQYVRNQWRSRALDYKRENGVYPRFAAFVNFVNERASYACDPVYGDEAFQCKPKFGKGSSCNVVDDGQSKPNEQAEAYPSRSVVGPCVVCQQSHMLLYCDRFKGLSLRESFDVVRKNKLCYNCLRAGHMALECRKPSVCSVPGCGKRHTKFLHIDRTHYRPEGNVASSNVSTGKASVYLPLVQVVVNGQCQAFALLDTGSTNTFVSESLVEKLNLARHKTRYEMNTISDRGTTCSQMVSLHLSSVENENELCLDDVFVVRNIPARYPRQEIDVTEYPYLRGLPLVVAGQDIKADIILGMDNAHVLRPIDIRCDSTRPNSPYATRTYFGWSLNGPVGGAPKEGYCNLISLERQVENMWEIESLDMGGEVRGPSVNDVKVLQFWEKETRMEGGHYVRPIPWKQDRPSFPDNRHVAAHRLRSLQPRLERTGMIGGYENEIRKMVDKGYAEPVPRKDLRVRDESVWYLPHHCVTSESKPGKVRVVFDCAATYAGVSLNNQCHQGPDLNNKLIGVLLRFRQYPYAVMADIESMYLQVKIPVYDRNALRFLWGERGEVKEYRMTSHLFGGVWCASSSTYALRRTVEEFPTNELIKDTVLRGFYVDDMLKSVVERSEAWSVVKDTKRVLRRGGFNLTKFVVNDISLLNQIPKEDRANEVKELTPHIVSRALGIKWDVSNDCFYYVSKIRVGTTKVTRRVMLSQVSSMYDPLGLLGPIVHYGKVLFQNATRLRLPWDEPVPPSYLRSGLNGRVT